MHRTFAVFAVALALSISAFAQPKTRAKKASAPAPVAAPVKVESTSGESGIKFGVSGPLMLLGGSALWGANVLVLQSMNPNLSIGIETGIHIASASGGGASGSVWLFPIMPTVVYNFDSTVPTFSPFVGLGLGVAILNVSASFGGQSFSGTGTAFEGLLHVGAKFGAEKNFFADVKLGLVSSSFVFVPAVGWFF